MTTLADQVIAALRSGHDDLSAHVLPLDEKGLAQPSAAGAWAISDVLSHLGSGAQIALATLERALAGGGSAPDGFNQSVWDRWNAMTPAQQRDGFLAANQRLLERYESLDAVTRQELRIDLGFLPAPLDVAGAGRMRLVEFALHAWDVEAGLDPSTTLAPEAVPLLFEGLRPLLGWISKPDTLNGRHARIAVDLTGPDTTYGLLLGETVTVVDDRPQHPDGVLSATVETWMRLLTGRLSPIYTPSTVELTGPITLDDLRAVFPGY
jgi:uncharacterized protein (TIGR03083 family)